MNWLRKILALTLRIKTTGAVIETSRVVSKYLLNFVVPHETQVIVEFGGGYGNVTKSVLKEMNSNSKLYVFELDQQFYDELLKIKDDRLKVYNLSAEQCLTILDIGVVDVVISTLPLSFINKTKRLQIVQSSFKILKLKGIMLNVLYSTSCRGLFKKVFGNCLYKIKWNIPLAFIHFSTKNQ